MRYVDINFNDMPADFDRYAYDIAQTEVPKAGAYDTIDNVTKFALDPDTDFEMAYLCTVPSTIEQEIQETAARLADEQMRKDLTDATLAELFELTATQAATIAEQDEVLAAMFEGSM
jgi:hypothetical protein